LQVRSHSEIETVTTESLYVEDFVSIRRRGCVIIGLI
jgi:hypothetical protein